MAALWVKSYSYDLIFRHLKKDTDSSLKNTDDIFHIIFFIFINDSASTTLQLNQLKCIPQWRYVNVGTNNVLA